MGRRQIWSSAAVALIAAILALAAAPTNARISVESFAAKPFMGSPKLSPNGRFLAVPVQHKNGTIIIMDLDAPPDQKDTGVNVAADLTVDWVEWANDERLLVGLRRGSALKWRGKSYDTSISRVIALNRDGNNQVTLFGSKRSFHRNFDLSEIVHPLPGDPAAVLMGANDGKGNYNLYRVNVYDGKAEIVEEGTKNSYQWLTDVNGVARARWDYRPKRDLIEVYLRRGDTANWDKVAQYGEREFPDLNIVGFADDPRVAIVASRQTSDRYALYEYDVPSKTLGRQLFQNARVDVGEPAGGPLYDPLTTKLLGVYYVEDLWHSKYFDASLDQIQKKLDATFEEAVIVRLVSWSQDRSRLVAYAEGPREPGSFYLYDAKKGEARRIGKVYPDIPVGELGQVLLTKYIARDGTRLQGYLTIPPGKSDKNLPMVVMPHGGPEVRDFVQYDQWAQMLANRGYMVFQPNFRGSGGYGRAFAEAGHRQWGRLMQDDITDGVTALINDGTANKDRICIFGASYGGYAALAGGAFTPDLYKCVIAVAGVSDIPQMLEAEEDRFGTESAIYAYWVKRLGDPKKDLEQMKSVSPALRAAEFKVPVLLIHGSDDGVVPIDQSKRMNKALKAAGKSVKFIEIDDEGHGFSKPESDLRLLKELEQFLTAHIGS